MEENEQSIRSLIDIQLEGRYTVQNISNIESTLNTILQVSRMSSYYVKVLDYIELSNSVQFSLYYKTQKIFSFTYDIGPIDFMNDGKFPIINLYNQIAQAVIDNEAEQMLMSQDETVQDDDWRWQRNLV